MTSSPINDTFWKKVRHILVTDRHGAQRNLAEKLGITLPRLNNFLLLRRKSDEDLRREVCKELGISSYERFVFDDTPVEYLQEASGNSLADEQNRQEDVKLLAALLIEVAPPAFIRNLQARLKKMQELSEFDD